MKSLSQLMVLVAAIVTAPAAAQSCSCHLCQMMRAASLPSSPSHATAASAAVLTKNTEFATNFTPPSASSNSTNGSASSTAGPNTQVVFLDFDSATDAAESALDLDYTAFERQQILDLVREDYELFDFEFTLTQPTSGDFTTITMNDGPAFGIAEQIDFRNTDKNDNATVNVPFPNTQDQSRILLTSTTISHELGHILGLRHADAFGPIGSGINAESFASAGFAFPGPSDATESGFHIMQTDSDNGVPFETFFGEREAVKLSFNERGSVVSESPSSKGSIASAQSVSLAPLSVPNTLRVGEFADEEDFLVDAITITGNVDSSAGDFFSFQAEAGDVLYVEGISGILDPDVAGTSLGRFSDSIAARVQVFDEEGNLLDYFGDDASNSLGTEGIDSVLFDVLIPETGNYFVSIDGGGTSEQGFDLDGDGADDITMNLADDTPAVGDYELFIYTFGVDTGVRALSEGDFNGDGSVDALDLVMFRESLGSEVEIGSGADGNANGIVDPEDYRYWLGNFGRTTSPVAVPEPVSSLLFVAALLGPARRRRA